MIFKILRRLKLLTKPIRKDDVLMGDCNDFGMGSALEQSMHRLRTLSGKLLLSFWTGNDTYRLTVRGTAMPYYILDAEVLTRSLDDSGAFVWVQRSSQRRIPKKKIHDMILTGKLKRSKI